MCGVVLLGAAFLGCAMAVPALADSQARIVRLSDVHGAVEIDKNAGNGYERAFVNLPLTQGAILRTQDEGRAEVEFEDGSTLRLTPHTTVEFKSLSLSDGKHISELNLTDGKAYVNWLGKSGDALTLNFSRDKMTLLHVAHFRVETAPALAEVAVFKGEVEVVGPSGTLALGKKKMATFDPAADDKATLAKDMPPNITTPIRGTTPRLTATDIAIFPTTARSQTWPAMARCGSPISPAWDGTRSWMEPGHHIPDTVRFGCRHIRGDGRRICMATGSLCPEPAGCGSRADGATGTGLHVLLALRRNDSQRRRRQQLRAARL
jgi:hypothetical protein